MTSAVIMLLLALKMRAALAPVPFVFRRPSWRAIERRYLR